MPGWRHLAQGLDIEVGAVVFVLLPLQISRQPSRSSFLGVVLGVVSGLKSVPAKGVKILIGRFDLLFHIGQARRVVADNDAGLRPGSGKVERSTSVVQVRGGSCSLSTSLNCHRSSSRTPAGKPSMFCCLKSFCSCWVHWDRVSGPSLSETHVTTGNEAGQSM